MHARAERRRAGDDAARRPRPAARAETLHCRQRARVLDRAARPLVPAVELHDEEEHVEKGVGVQPRRERDVDVERHHHRAGGPPPDVLLDGEIDVGESEDDGDDFQEAHAYEMLHFHAMTYYGARNLADSFRTVRRNTLIIANEI